MDKNSKYAEVIYFEETAKMNKEEYKAVTVNVVGFFKIFFTNAINRILIDTRKNYYTISPELQVWTAQQFAQFKDYTMYKTATLISADLIASLSIEQVVEEVNNSIRDTSENHFFEDIDQARRWLLE